MSTKKSKKNTMDSGTPVNNNYKKKAKNTISSEIENNTNGDMKEAVNEDVNTSSITDSNEADIKVIRKRKQTDMNTEAPIAKKSKKKKGLNVSNDLPDLELPVSSCTINGKDLNESSTQKKGRKKKSKTTTSTEPFLATDHNGGAINMLEISVKQNGENKDKPSQEPEQNSSYKYIGASRSQNKSIDYMKGMELQNTINSSEEKLSNEDEIIHLPDKNLEDTDSEINENDVLAANKFAATKGSKQDLMNWPTEDLKKLVDRMEACIPEHDVLAFNTRAEKLQWDSIAFKDYSMEDCKKMWLLLLKQIRRFRLLKEVLVDVREWIDSPKTKSKKPKRHPDMPRKPLSAYFLYYMKKRDISHKSHPGLDATEISKILAQEFKSLPPEKRLKYEKLAVKKKEEYEQKLEEFYQGHPEVPRIVKVAKVKPDKTPKHPKSPKPPKPAKEKSPPKPPKERIPKRPPPPFQYFYLSELEKEGAAAEDKTAFKEICKDRWKELNDKKKLIWINYAEAEYRKYEEALKQYIQSHPDYTHNPHKSILTKEEIQIKERVAGKPSKPPSSAYNLFARMLLQSDEIKAVPIKDRLNYVSNKWKNCAEEEKKQYKDLSAQLNEKYKLEFASYLETLPEEERKQQLQKNIPKRKKSEDAEKVGPSQIKEKRSERKVATKKLVEPEQPPRSAFKYFATLYSGEEPVAQAWKALTPEQKKIYEDELVKKKQAYIVDFEKFLKSLTKEELEAFSNSRQRIKNDDEEEDEESSDESGTEDSEADSNEDEEEEDE